MSSLKLLATEISAIFLLIVATVIRSGELYFMSAALACIPFVSYFVSRLALRSLDFNRELPEYAIEDEPINVSVKVEGKSSYLGPIEIEDELPEWIEKDDDSEATVHSEECTKITYTAYARKRGVYSIDLLKLYSSDPMGFFGFPARCHVSSKLTILPRPLQIHGLRTRPLGKQGDQQFEGSGAKGSGIDFHGVREYQVGDELRRIHWSSTARHGRLNVVEFEHTRMDDAVIAIDLSKGTGIGRFTSTEYTVKIAAGIAQQALTLGNTVRLIGAGIDGMATTPGTGLDHLYVILNALARAGADHKESLSSVLTRETDLIAQSSSVICLASTLDDETSQCIRTLASSGIKVEFILVTLSNTPSERIEELAAKVVSSGASLVVVECATNAIGGRISYEYVNQY